MIGPWKRINIPHAKRKLPNPLIHELIIEIKDVRGKHHAKIGTELKKLFFQIVTVRYGENGKFSTPYRN